MTGATVIVIAKAPIAGTVKTRCCPPCTPEQAAGLAAAALADTLAVVAASRASRRVLALDGPAGDWLPSGFEVVVQRVGGLGARIDGAFADVGGPAFLVGMDTPQLTVASIDSALDVLHRRTADAVVGRAADGGFWSLGLAEPTVDLCRSVTMSVPTTCAELHGALRERNMTWYALEELADVDDFAAACLVAAQLPGTRFAASVETILAEIGAPWPRSLPGDRSGSVCS